MQAKTPWKIGSWEKLTIIKVRSLCSSRLTTLGKNNLSIHKDIIPQGLWNPFRPHRLRRAGKCTAFIPLELQSRPMACASQTTKEGASSITSRPMGVGKGMHTLPSRWTFGITQLWNWSIKIMHSFPIQAAATPRSTCATSPTTTSSWKSKASTVESSNRISFSTTRRTKKILTNLQSRNLQALKATDWLWTGDFKTKQTWTKRQLPRIFWVRGLSITIVIIYWKMDQGVMTPGTRRRFRAFRTKIAIGRLDRKLARIYIKEQMLRRFNMITRQAPIYISARDLMRNTGVIHRLSKAEGNPQRTRRWSLTLAAWEGNCKRLLLRKPE